MVFRRSFTCSNIQTFLQHILRRVYRGKHRDTEHPGEDMGEVYAREIDTILMRMEARPAAFIAESFQSCGGQIIFPDSYLAKVAAAPQDDVIHVSKS